jgi:DNA-binding transcriptional regulator YhcF (GntR family)
MSIKIGTATPNEVSEDMADQTRILYVAIGAVLDARRIDVVLSALGKHFVETCIEVGMSREDFLEIVARVYDATKESNEEDKQYVN